MKIFNTQQIREADQYTIDHEPIKSSDLMERAAKSFVQWFEQYFEKQRKVFIFCGTGNNGGDGLAIARMLSFKKWQVKTVMVSKSSNKSHDCMINYLKLAEVREVAGIASASDLNFEIEKNDIVVDAIFGSGLSRPVDGIHAETIAYINQSGATVVSVDVPSGLFADDVSPKGAIVRADHVVSFQFPKLAFMLAENSMYIKNWIVADIGLHPEFIKNTESPYEYLEHSFIKNLLRKRTKFEHKGNFGHSLIIAGSHGKMGAAVLCSKACLKTGAGLVTAHIPGCGYHTMQTSIPEVMVSVDYNKKFLTSIPELDAYEAIGIGPGIDKNIETYEVISQLLANYKKPIVVDADALNIISKEQNMMKSLPEGSILTPHPGEFKRMVGFWNDDFERLEQQIAISKQYKVYIVLKGGHASISTPEGKVYFNSTGNPGMATGGSGDVLTGMITSLLGQGYSSLHASLLGVYLHGLSGDIAVQFMGEEGLCASDLIDFLPQAFMELREENGK
ncbi:MAG: NAD(P)H-hydrate dehydratase [Cyclobacteriaceae bacterium]|nr:NAD(P)H-hydrate dehydratase [Cyclobacteriaceae bacterium]